MTLYSVCNVCNAIQCQGRLQCLQYMLTVYRTVCLQEFEYGKAGEGGGVLRGSVIRILKNQFTVKKHLTCLNANTAI